MKVVIGSDHAGFGLKEKLKIFLLRKGVKVKDLGPEIYNKSDDYVNYAKVISKEVSKNKTLKGILICGTGTGMCIVANRFKGVRAAVVFDNYSAIMSRRDNDANIICLRGRRFSSLLEKRLLWLWLNTSFSNLSRHKKRIKELG